MDNTENSEGKTFEISALNLYNKIQQGDKIVLDLGDYFSSFKIRFNALPKPKIVGTHDCPVNPVDTNGDGVYDRYEIPSISDCVSVKFVNLDGLGYNAQYSRNGTNFNNIDYNSTYNLTSLNLPQGNTTNPTLYVKEYLDEGQTILDQKTITLPTIYKEIDKVGNTDLIGTIQDYTTGNTWNVGDGIMVEFADPGNNTNAGIIKINGSSAPYGNCKVWVRKDDNDLYWTDPMPCNNITANYTVPASDKGTGGHGIEFIVYKQYKTGESSYMDDVIDRFSIGYQVNEAPTTNP